MTELPQLISEPPLAGSETEALLGSLDRMRRTFAWKCADLDAAAMARTVGTSTVTLGGLLRHLTRCEASSFAWKAHDLAFAGSESDWAGDWAWTGTEDVGAAWRAWTAAVQRSHDLVAEALADGGLERTGGHEFPGWGTPSLRRIMVDMIEEYSRHTGHADLIRESIDGRVGEDPPADF